MHDLAVAQSDHARRPVGEAQFVRRHDQCRAGVGDLIEQMDERLTTLGVEADEGLVDEQQFERADEGDGNRRLLP